MASILTITPQRTADTFGQGELQGQGGEKKRKRGGGGSKKRANTSKTTTETLFIRAVRTSRRQGDSMCLHLFFEGFGSVILRGKNGL